MQYSTSAVTQKGQVTIPLQLRQKLGLKPYSRVMISEGDKCIKIEPMRSAKDLAGVLYNPKIKPLSIAEMRKIRESGLVFNDVAK